MVFLHKPLKIWSTFLFKTTTDVIMDLCAHHYKNKLMLLLEVSPLTFVARRWLKNFGACSSCNSFLSLHLSITIIRDRITNVYVTKLTQTTNCYCIWGTLIAFITLWAFLIMFCKFSNAVCQVVDIQLVDTIWNILRLEYYLFSSLYGLDSIFTEQHRAVQQEEDKIKAISRPKIWPYLAEENSLYYFQHSTQFLFPSFIYSLFPSFPLF